MFSPAAQTENNVRVQSEKHISVKPSWILKDSDESPLSLMKMYKHTQDSFIICDCLPLGKLWGDDAKRSTTVLPILGKFLMTYRQSVRQRRGWQVDQNRHSVIFVISLIGDTLTSRPHDQLHNTTNRSNPTIKR